MAACLDAPFPVWPSALCALRAHPHSAAVASAACFFVSSAAPPLAGVIEAKARRDERFALLTRGFVTVDRRAGAPLSPAHGDGTAPAIVEILGRVRDGAFDDADTDDDGAVVASAAFTAVGHLCSCKGAFSLCIQ